MSIRHLILAVLFVSFVASASTAARADDCPVRVSSVVLEGKGIAGHVYRYRVVLSANSGAKPPDVGLQIRFGTNRAPLHATASNLRMRASDETYDSVVIFERPAADVSDVAVVDTQSGNVATPCSSTIANVENPAPIEDGWDVPSVLATLDDAMIDPPDAARVVLLVGDSKDAVFRTKGTLNYPEVAQDMNVSGVSRALVTIDPSGKLDGARIAYSSGSKALDDAALAAVHGSTFSGSIFDGIPVENAYYVVYEFVLDTSEFDDFDPHALQHALKTYCPAILNDITLATGLFSNSAFWYDVNLTTTRSRFDFVSLAVVGAAPPVKTLTWQIVTSGVDRFIGSSDNVDRDTQSDEGALFWPGPALAAGTVQQAKLNSKAAQSCKPYGAHVGYELDRDSLVAVADTDRPWLDAPILESVLPARFNSISWPKYTPSASDPPNAVAFDVRVHVTQMGEPVVAIVRGASLAPGFAAAALNAAMTSTYVVPRTADGIPLTQTFNIVYVYVPASAAAGKPVGLVSHDRSDGNRRSTPHD